MRRVLLIFVALAAMLAADTSRAMPVARGFYAPPVAVTRVAGGCGPFRHRGFFGYCRLNMMRPYGPYGFNRPFRFYRPFVFIRRPFFRAGPRF